jgi:hypothetical protein
MSKLKQAGQETVKGTGIRVFGGVTRILGRLAAHPAWAAPAFFWSTPSIIASA